MSTGHTLSFLFDLVVCGCLHVDIHGASTLAISYWGETDSDLVKTPKRNKSFFFQETALD
jgi:hypothetical protein